MATQNSTTPFQSAQGNTIEDLFALVEDRMPDPKPKPLTESARAALLDTLNQEIVNADRSAKLAEVFCRAAELAEIAIQTVNEVQYEPGVENADLAEVLNFWYRARDYMRVASFDFRGANNSLVEALATRRLVEKSEGTI